MTLPNSAFISYSRRNLYLAQRLNDDLRRAGCASPWFDQGSIPVNAEWERKIEEGIVSQDAFVYLWSPEAGVSPHVQKEYEIAQRHDRKIAIVLVAGRVADMPPELQHLQYIDLIKAASPLNDAFAALQIAKPQTWFVQDPNRSPAEQRRTFVKFPVLPSGYSTSWLVTDTQKDLELQPDLHFVLKFTDMVSGFRTGSTRLPRRECGPATGSVCRRTKEQRRSLYSAGRYASSLGGCG